MSIFICSHPPLVLAGCREKPCPVFLAEVDDLKRKNIAGRRLLGCPHHSVEEPKYVILYVMKISVKEYIQISTMR